MRSNLLGLFRRRRRVGLRRVIEDVLNDFFGKLVAFQERVTLPTDDALRVHDEDVRDPFHLKGLLHPRLRVNGAEILDFRGGELFHSRFSLVGQADDDELVAKFFVELVEFRNGLAAGRAPGGPKINEHELALGIRLG